MTSANAAFPPRNRRFLPRIGCWLVNVNVLFFCGTGLSLVMSKLRKRWPFSLLNDEQMNNKVGVKHQRGKLWYFLGQDGHI